MSIINELVKKLRVHAQYGNFADHRHPILMREAADEIEELSAKLRNSKFVWHGVWAQDNKGNHDPRDVWVKCSCCGYQTTTRWSDEFKYCPNCGAKMDAESEEFK